MSVLMPDHGSHGWDTTCWTNWSVHIFKNGLFNVYNSDCNYPPLYPYLLKIFGMLKGSEDKIVAGIPQLKLIVLLFDILPVLVLLAARRTFELSKGYPYLLLFNIGYLYNTVIWGQVDSIHSNLVATAIFIAWRLPVLSALLFVLALNMKLQAIFFLPVWVLCMVVHTSWRKACIALLSCIALQVAILLPFQHIGILSLEFHVDKLSRPLL